MELNPHSDHAVPPSSTNSKPSPRARRCSRNYALKLQDQSSADQCVQVPLLLQAADHPLDSTTTMGGGYQIAGTSYSVVLRMAGAEMVAVFLIMFSSCGTSIANRKTNGDLNLLGFAAAGGLSVMMMVFAVGDISGAHLNPAITLAFASKRMFPLQLVPIYLLAQFLGALLATGVLQALTGDAEAALTVPFAGYTQAFIVELVVGFNLMFVASAVSTGSNNSGELAGIAVGASIILNVLLAGCSPKSPIPCVYSLVITTCTPVLGHGSISGASMNPIRSLAPAIVANKYNGIWIYLIAPPLGALAGTWTHTLLQTSS